MHTLEIVEPLKMCRNEPLKLCQVVIAGGLVQRCSWRTSEYASRDDAEAGSSSAGHHLLWILLIAFDLTKVDYQCTQKAHRPTSTSIN